MPSMKDLDKAPRRELHIFLVLDSSKSMVGAPIDSLNRAVSNAADKVKRLAETNSDALIKIAVLEFNSGCRWLQPKGPEEMEDFYWQPLTAGGTTNIGAALRELDSKLSRKAFLGSMTGAYLPVIIFMTDGYASDDYRKPLEQIRKNKWFSRGTKIGFAVGAEADAGMISEIVGSSRSVISTDDWELFESLFTLAVVKSSMLCSTSHTSTDEINGADIVEQIKEEVGIEGDEENPSPSAEDALEEEEPSPSADDSFEWETFF